MHYYQFNIADYRKDTQHLTMVEHYIYRELIDWIYLDEKPIPNDIKLIVRRLRLTEQDSTTVEQVLNEFFTETEFGYTQDRVMREISDYTRKIESASKAGKASAEARKTKAESAKSNDRSTTVQPTINHKPLTINQLKEKTSPEPKAHDNPILKLPTNKFNTQAEEYSVDQVQLNDWQDTYPAVDVLQTLKRIKSWCSSNPTKRKTKSGMPKFIDAWLAKNQNEGSGKNENNKQLDAKPRSNHQGVMHEIQQQLKAV